MKRQRGFGWIEGVICIVALAALFFAVRAVIAEVAARDEKIRSTAYAAGRADALKEVAQRDNAELIAAQDQVASLTLERDTAAALHAEQQARLKRDHDKEVANEAAKRDDLLRRVRSGELVFIDPGQQGGACGAGQVDAGRGGFSLKAGAAAAAAVGSGQAVGGGLSRQAAEFLLAEADRADTAARELNLCWGIAKDDRKRAGAAP